MSLRAPGSTPHRARGAAPRRWWSQPVERRSILTITDVYGRVSHRTVADLQVASALIQATPGADVLQPLLPAADIPTARPTLQADDQSTDEIPAVSSGAEPQPAGVLTQSRAPASPAGRGISLLVAPEMAMGSDGFELGGRLGLGLRDAGSRLSRNARPLLARPRRRQRVERCHSPAGHGRDCPVARRAVYVAAHRDSTGRRGGARVRSTWGNSPFIRRPTTATSTRARYSRAFTLARRTRFGGIGPSRGASAPTLRSLRTTAPLQRKVPSCRASL